MGNFLSNQSSQPGGSLAPSTQDGTIWEITFSVHPDGEVTSELAYQPTMVNRDGHVIELATPDTNAESYARTVAAVESLGPGACDATLMSQR